MAVLGLSVDSEEGATESPFAFLSRTRGDSRGGDVQDSSSHVGVCGFQQHCSFCVQAGVREAGVSPRPCWWPMAIPGRELKALDLRSVVCPSHEWANEKGTRTQAYTGALAGPVRRQSSWDKKLGSGRDRMAGH